jgi:threonyl-tRNA synthetase
LEDGGFYYDCEMGDRTVVPEDFTKLQSVIDKMISDKFPFQRLVLQKKDALEMFKHNPFKVQIISGKIPDGGTCTVYRCGPLIDLCKGPHVANTGMIKAMTVTKNSSSYWLGNAENAQLQRVYGISFPDKKKLKEYLEFLELASQRDHRKVGADQQLFFFHDISPGSCFFLPHGARIYNRLIEFIRSEYRKRGFTEVISPNVFNIDLWKTSGHYDNYKENMFLFEVEKTEFGMKPMNCPGHCIMFKHLLRSYRDLPVRYADFGVLHRNEFSGALTGLTRVRRFQQDDAHIFCRENQIEQEVSGALDFLTFVYSKFGFEFSIALSTRPEKFLGEIQQWDRAEKALADCLDRCGQKWKLNPGDGAFYGPKIDIQLTDALKRKHQCATIQLDFQLPIRFGLQYKNEDGSFARPVIIHRAILGSVERMMAVLTEHTGGKWPFWLSPRQAVVIPVAPNFIDYAQQVQKQLWAAGYWVDVDDSRNQLNKKIREGQLAQYNFILVVGGEEQAAGGVNVRTRDNQVRADIVPIPQLLEEWKVLVAEFK